MPFELSIVTPQGASFSGSVESIVLPGSEGDFGVLPNHERFLCPLRVGEVKVEASGQTFFAAVSGGFADISGEQVTVLADSCELATNIDVNRAEVALQRAEKNLAEKTGGTEDRIDEFETAVARAKNRLEISARK